MVLPGGEMRILILSIAVLSMLACTEANPRPFDHNFNRYGDLLAKHDKNGLVDYKTLAKNRTILQDIADEFGEVSRKQLDSFSDPQKIAFWINAYNFFTIQAIVDHFPVSSIKKIDGVWDRLKFSVAGKNLTLNNIEHDILRKQFNEPRIHVALVCASISCPELWNRPFVGDSLDTYLTRRSQAFANDSSRNEIDPSRSSVKLSKILDWYGDDFISLYGDEANFSYLSKKEAATVNFIFQHLSEDTRSALSDKELSVNWLDYDWNLNIQ